MLVVLASRRLRQGGGEIEVSIGYTVKLSPGRGWGLEEEEGRKGRREERKVGRWALGRLLVPPSIYMGALVTSRFPPWHFQSLKQNNPSLHPNPPAFLGETSLSCRKTLRAVSVD